MTRDKNNVIFGGILTLANYTLKLKLVVSGTIGHFFYGGCRVLLLAYLIDSVSTHLQ